MNDTVEEPVFTVDYPVAHRKPWFRRLFAVAAAVAVVAGGAAATAGLVLPTQVKVVKGKLASKAEFFLDDRVSEILMAHGFQVHLTQVGSRAIAGDVDGFDFVFPSGQQTALPIREERKRQGLFVEVYKPFFSPIVLGTFQDYARALAGEAVATEQREPTGERLYYDLDLKGFTDLMERGRTWKDLGVDNGNRVLAQSPDVCWSNSAGTYLGLVSFAVNGGTTPSTEEQAVGFAARIRPMLTGQGMASEDIPRMYLSPEGRGLAPVAVMYEHQYLAHQLRSRENTGALDRDRVLLYPAAQLQTVPEFLALTPEGDELGRLIANDPELRERALELGYRPLNPDDLLATQHLPAFLERRGIPVPRTGVGDTETFLPALPLLEKMITEVGGCP